VPVLKALLVEEMILSIIKYGAFVVLCIIGLGQTVIYFRIKKYWESLPLAAATITEARLFDLTGDYGHRTYEAIISFKYEFLGKEYEANTPALRSPQLFPMYGYEWSLLDKYKVGEMHNVRVHPNMPEVAYLEIAPLSQLSLILLPLLILGYFAYLVGVGYYFTWSYDVFTN